MKGEGERGREGGASGQMAQGFPESSTRPLCTLLLETPTMLFTMGNSLKRIAQALANVVSSKQETRLWDGFPGSPESWISWVPWGGRSQGVHPNTRVRPGVDADNRVN